ncbi:MAG TPA: peptidase M24 family protein [Acidimicrobiaceae bacterium]|nr:peptidase M24 family protein [Acidimicrobiaceae bacterium]
MDGDTVRHARAARLERVRRRMEELEVDALLLSHGAELPWLTGYRAMPLERLTLLVVRPEGEVVLLVPALEAPRLPLMGIDVSVRPWSDTEDPIELASALLPDAPGSRLALSDRAWAATLIGLQQELPEATFLSASTVTAPLRAVKDHAEVAALRLAAEAADRVAGALQAGEIALVGRTEREVSRHIAERLLAEGHRHVNFAIVGSGPNGASPHHDAGERRIGRNEVVVCDFGGELVAPWEDVGYCSDITRTVVTGDPGDEVRRCYEVLRLAQASAVAAACAGIAAEDVDAAARDVIAAAGLGERFIHRTGHGIGIDEHEDPYVVAGNRTALVEGHAFSVEPGIYLPGRFGMRLEDIVVVGPEGPEPLNRVDHDLVVVDA